MKTRLLVVESLHRDTYWQVPQPDPGSYQWRSPGTYISVTERKTKHPAALIKVEFFDGEDPVELLEAIKELVGGVYADSGAAVTLK